TTAIECDDPVLGRERCEDAWALPVRLDAGGEAMDEHERFALAFDDVANGYAVGLEEEFLRVGGGHESDGGQKQCNQAHFHERSPDSAQARIISGARTFPQGAARDAASPAQAAVA